MTKLRCVSLKVTAGRCLINCAVQAWFDELKARGDARAEFPTADVMHEEIKSPKSERKFFFYMSVTLNSSVTRFFRNFYRIFKVKDSNNKLRDVMFTSCRNNNLLWSA